MRFYNAINPIVGWCLKPISYFQSQFMKEFFTFRSMIYVDLVLRLALVVSIFLKTLYAFTYYFLKQFFFVKLKLQICFIFNF